MAAHKLLRLAGQCLQTGLDAEILKLIDKPDVHFLFRRFIHRILKLRYYMLIDKVISGLVFKDSIIMPVKIAPPHLGCYIAGKPDTSELTGELFA
jgi:hypothetical protein